MNRFDLSPLRGRRWLGLSLALCAGVTGCNVIPAAQSDPTRYYVLSTAASAEPAGGPSDAHRAVRLGLRTVDVAAYLKGPEIVVRTGSNEVRLQDYARWAEPLQAGITRILREQLSGSVARVDVQPFPLDQERDFDVAVTILHCEGAAGGGAGRGAQFEASIRISTAGAKPDVVARKVFTAPEAAWDGRNFDALAKLLSADIQALGDAIVAALPATSG